MALVCSLLRGGADKAQYVDFSPGSAELPAGSSDALGMLPKSLADRPELQLDIPAAPATREDALARANTEIDKQATGTTGGFAALDAGDQYKDLAGLYTTKLGKQPHYPEVSPDALKAASNKSE